MVDEQQQGLEMSKISDALEKLSDVIFDLSDINELAIRALKSHGWVVCGYITGKSSTG